MPKSQKPISLNLKKILPKIRTFIASKKDAIIDIETLKQLEIIPTRYKGEVKILGTGDLDSTVVFKGIKTSKNAKMKIEKAGGRIQ